MKIFNFLLIILFSIVVVACGGGGGESPTSVTYSISGTVTSTGSALPGVAINLTGASTASTTTAADGSYSFAGLSNGNHTVTSSLAGYAFSPLNTLVSVSGANVSNINFTATAAATTYSISGTLSGAASSGVTLTLDGDNTGSVMTGVGGAYNFSSLAFGNYTVTPSLSGYTFNPTNIAVTGWFAFQNFASGLGILGTVSTGGIFWMGQNVFPFFELNPNPNPPDGVGAIRARRRAEIAPADLAGYDNMWTTGGTVVVTFNTDVGPFTIDIQLGTNPTIALSSTSFTFQERLTNATANDFVATAIP